MGKSKAMMPTREQQDLMESHGLIASCWLVIRDSERELQLVSRLSGSTRRIKKRPSPASCRGTGNLPTSIIVDSKEKSRCYRSPVIQ